MLLNEHKINVFKTEMGIAMTVFLALEKVNVYIFPC